MGFSLIADYGINSFDTRGINDFVDSYNDFWGSKLSSPYARFSGKELSHANFGAGLRLVSGTKVGFTGHTAFLLGFGQHQQVAEWENGVQNELGFKVRDWQWTFSSGVHLWNTVFLEGYTGAHIRRIRMTHTTIYQDGSRSLSSEYKLNGLYNGSVSSFDVGFQAGIRIKPVMLFAKVVWPLENFPPGKDLVSLLDEDSPNFPPTDFPSDYPSYATDVIGFVEEDRGLKTDDFEGMRIVFGVEFIFGARVGEK